MPEQITPTVSRTALALNLPPATRASTSSMRCGR